MIEPGLAQAVYETDLGTTLSADYDNDIPVLLVASTANFNLHGGQLELVNDVQASQVMSYGDTTDSELTGPAIVMTALPTNDWAMDDTIVKVYPHVTVRYAEVQLDSTRDTVRARVPMALYDKLPLGSRDVAEYQRVFVELRDGEYWVVDVLGEPPIVDAKFQPALAAKVYMDIAASIPDSVHTTVVWLVASYEAGPGIEVGDYWFWAGGATERAKLYIPVAGYWSIVARAKWASNATGRRIMRLKYVPQDTGVPVDVDEDVRAPSAGGATSMNTSMTHYFDAGDWVEATVWQNSGAALNLVGGESETHITACFEGS